MQVGGPTFETPAEMRFLRIGGGDAVGKRLFLVFNFSDLLKFLFQE